MDSSTAPEHARQPSRDLLGAVAAGYMAMAYLGAMWYYLVFAGGAQDPSPAHRLAFIVSHSRSLEFVNFMAYVAFGLAVIVLTVSLRRLLLRGAERMASVATAIGIAWACTLIASGSVANAGIEYALRLNATDPESAAAAWMVFDTVSSGLGGAGGEVLGGPWALLLGLAILRTRVLPIDMGRLGVMIGIVGCISVIPPLRMVAALFGLLQVPWLIWMSICVLRTPADSALTNVNGCHREKPLCGEVP